MSISLLGEVGICKKMELIELKTLAIKEIVQLARQNSANDQNEITKFLNEIPAESNYLIEKFFFGYYSRVAQPICFRKSTQTFATHISLDTAILN